MAHTITEEDIANFDPNAKFVYSKPEPKVQTDANSCVLIDQLPKVPKEKISLLQKVIEKVVTRESQVKVENLYLPTNKDDGSTLG